MLSPLNKIIFSLVSIFYICTSIFLISNGYTVSLDPEFGFNFTVIGLSIFYLTLNLGVYLYKRFKVGPVFKTAIILYLTITFFLSLSFLSFSFFGLKILPVNAISVLCNNQKYYLFSEKVPENIFIYQANGIFLYRIGSVRMRNYDIKKNLAQNLKENQEFLQVRDLNENYLNVPLDCVARMK